MTPRVIRARYLRGFVVHLEFADGAAGSIDLAPYLEGPAFEALRNPEYFRTFCVHPVFHTLVWDNGADFAPEFLYRRVTIGSKSA